MALQKDNPGDFFEVKGLEQVGKTDMYILEQTTPGLEHKAGRRHIVSSSKGEYIVIPRGVAVDQIMAEIRRDGLSKQKVSRLRL